LSVMFFLDTGVFLLVPRSLRSPTEFIPVLSLMYQ
jgi:hypothetical protein